MCFFFLYLMLFLSEGVCIIYGNGGDGCFSLDRESIFVLFCGKSMINKAAVDSFTAKMMTRWKANVYVRVELTLVEEETL